MGKMLCFLYDSMVSFEMTLACSLLQSNGKPILSIGYEKIPVKCSANLTLHPEKTVGEMLANGLGEIEGLIIPGGYTRVVKPELKQLIRKLDGEGKLLAAICAGPEFLAKSGALNGKKYTTTLTPGSYDENNEEDPFDRGNYLEQRLVRDRNVVTAKGSAFVDFALGILSWFDMFDNEAEKEEFRKYYTPSAAF
ncbi:MAG: DJ-1/PfpI family protein [Candidatus Odinarchaeota archaeon]